MAGNLVILLVAYLLGSIPSALAVSRVLAGADIRQAGDGHMGARNVSRTFGWGPGLFVSVADFGKGALAVWMAQVSNLPPGWQMAAAVAAVIGHDFPVFAEFRGGQGMAAILGTLYALAPIETMGGLAVFGAATWSRVTST